VTHDHSEALTLADEVAVMRAGQIEQLASPDVLVERPATPAVADFLRLGSLVDVEYREDTCVFKDSDIVLARNMRLKTATARVLIPVNAMSIVAPTQSQLSASVLRSQFRGDGHLATVSLAGLSDQPLQVFSRTKLRVGDIVGLAIEESRIRWFK
jgi:iron(III) transport system ATP-binding protein